MIFNEKDIDAIEKTIENPEKYQDAIVLIRNIKEKISHWEETEDIVFLDMLLVELEYQMKHEDAIDVDPLKDRIWDCRELLRTCQE